MRTLMGSVVLVLVLLPSHGEGASTAKKSAKASSDLELDPQKPLVCPKGTKLMSEKESQWCFKETGSGDRLKHGPAILHNPKLKTSSETAIGNGIKDPFSGNNIEISHVYGAGNFDEGEMSGLWTFYNENTERQAFNSEKQKIWKRSESYFTKGLETGLFKLFYQSKVVLTGQLNDMSMTGTWIKYNADDGRKLWECVYKNSLPAGKCVSYFKNGKPQTDITFDDNGKQDGEHIKYFENGKKDTQWTYSHGEESARSEWNEKGILISKCYDKNHQFCNSWDDNGKPREEFVGIDKTGMPFTGISKQYDNSGKVTQEIEHWQVDGKQASEINARFNAGKKIYEREKIKDSEGRSIEVIRQWYDNGNIQSETRRMNGRRYGNSTEWSNNKVITSINCYEGGDHPVTVTTWNEAGKKTFDNDGAIDVCIPEGRILKGRTVTIGKLTMSNSSPERERAVMDALRSLQNGFLFCYEEGLSVNQKIYGEIEYSTQQIGGYHDARIYKSSNEDIKSIDKCLRKVIRRFELKDGPSEMHVTLNFANDKKQEASLP